MILSTQTEIKRTMVLKGHRVTFFKYEIVTYIEPPLKKGYYAWHEDSKDWSKLSRSNAMKLYFNANEEPCSLVFIGGKNEIKNTTNSFGNNRANRRGNSYRLSNSNSLLSRVKTFLKEPKHASLKRD